MTAAVAIGLIRRPTGRNTVQPFVSVVVAARNEEAYIGDCLASLTDQTYPADRYEIIVVDDDSDDRTREIANQHDRVTVLSPSVEYSDFAAKKRPMATGISLARGEIILTTDADCTVPDTWVETVVEHFTEEIDVVVGYSKIAPTDSTWTHRFQSFDFHALLSAAAGIVGLGSLWAATGQNLGYRKRVYDRVGGFSRISNRPSGDDVLLAQLFRRSGARAAFCYDPAGHATTWRSESLPGLINQRRRWASNAAVQLRLNPMLFAYVASVLAVNVLPIAALLFGGPLVFACIVIWGGRVVLDTTVLALSGRRLGTRPPWAWFLPWLFLQIPYVIIVGFFGTLFGFEWKDRTHRAASRASVPYTLNDQPETNNGTM